MSFLPAFLNPLLLLGLIAVLIPPIIHLLNRRRFDVVDWAAMQFLDVGSRTRRKLFLEELLLMLLRMGLIALFVMALAAPKINSSWLADLAGRSNRDLMLIVDGSASMGLVTEEATQQQHAVRFAEDLLDALQPGDGVGLIDARQVPNLDRDALLSNFAPLRTGLRELRSPAGGLDMPAAVQQASRRLNQSNLLQREMVILSDGRRQGWTDPAALERWELLSRKLAAEEKELPRMWVVDVAPTGSRDQVPNNRSLEAIYSSRTVAVVGNEVRLRTALRLSGPETGPPGNLELAIDGRPAGTVPVPKGERQAGKLPLSFTQRFAAPGSHLVTLTLPEDSLAADNRRDFALEVLPAIPVLIVDGDPRTTVDHRVSDFLRDALAPRRHPSPPFAVKVVPISQFSPPMLREPVQSGKGLPLVLALMNVQQLAPEQQKAVTDFLSDGGSVLVTLGDRVQAEEYNQSLFRDGDGWLPARLVDPVGDVNDLTKALRLEPASFTHPALELFREPLPGGLASAYFPRYWKLETPADTRGIPLALLGNRSPWLVEREYAKGRVILAAVPLDASWRTNLTTLPDYVRLMHELCYYLAGGRRARFNLEPGQPLVYQPESSESPGPVRIELPDGGTRRVEVDTWPLVFEDTQQVGVYTMTTDTGRRHYYVIQPDPAEFDLTPLTEDDHNQLTSYVADLRFANRVEEVVLELNRADEEQEIWWIVLLLVLGFLLVELWITRRMALRTAT